MKRLLLPALLVFTASAQAQTVRTLTETEKQEAIEVHNKARADVGVGPLAWSDTLAQFASAWGKELASQGCKIRHRPRSGEWAQQYGENIFWSSAGSSTLAEASRSWYSEIRDFRNVTLEGNNWYKTGHYSQMVWRNTQRVGMAAVTCPNGSVIIVANYDPPGNYMGEKAY
jgi:pathogenesis-related protein 1